MRHHHSIQFAKSRQNRRNRDIKQNYQYKTPNERTRPNPVSSARKDPCREWLRYMLRYCVMASKPHFWRFGCILIARQDDQVATREYAPVPGAVTRRCEIRGHCKKLGIKSRALLECWALSEFGYLPLTRPCNSSSPVLLQHKYFRWVA